MNTMRGFWVDAEWAPRPNCVFSDWELSNKIAIRGSWAWKNLTSTMRTDLPIPDCLEDEVLIRVGACGICGSDVSLIEQDMDGYIDYSSQCSFPFVPGHEFSGEVVAVGTEVKRLHVGDFVSAENMQWCGRCVPCLSGNVNQCERVKLLGFDRENDGALAEYVAVNEKYCWPLNQLRGQYSDQEVFDLGALVEPASCAYEAIVNNSQGLRPGDNAVVMGAGGIGLASLQLLKTLGAAKIIVFEPVEKRRALAKALGADHVLDPFDNGHLGSNVLMELTDGQGVGLAIEASRNPARNFPLVENAIHYGGELLCISMAAQYPRIDYMRFIRRNIKYSGSFGHAGHCNFRQVINLMASRRVDLLPIITARFPLEEALAAIEAASTGKEGKVIVRP